MFTDADLDRRGAATLVASWEAYARGAAGAAVHRLPGVVAGVFPDGPERDVYDNALLERGLGPVARGRALDAMEAAYAAQGVGRFAAWVRESDDPMRRALERRGASVAAGIAFDHDGDCGISNVGTSDHARRRGLGTALTALLAHDARARGCATASLQRPRWPSASTPPWAFATSAASSSSSRRPFGSRRRGADGPAGRLACAAWTPPSAAT